MKNLGMAIKFALETIGANIQRRKPPKPPEIVADIGTLEAYLQQLIAVESPPGLSLVVIKDGKIVYNKSFGLADGPNNIPATPNTVYRWMSMTKIATAIAILQLHERGLLNIDYRVHDYLPFFKMQPGPETNNIITIRNLLNHSSGIVNPLAVLGWLHIEGEPHLNQTELVERMLPKYTKLKFEPGKQAAYTNLGYMVLGAIIEAVSNQTYEDYVMENILRPLKMEHTNFIYTDEMLPYEAIGSHPTAHMMSIMLPFVIENLGNLIRETVDGRMWFKRIYPDQTPPTGLIGPAAGAARLVAAYLNRGELDGVRILSSQTVQMMTQEGHVVTKGPEARAYKDLVHGLGWWIMPESKGQYLFHLGDGPGFSAGMRVYPERNLGTVVMGNDWAYGISLRGKSVKDTILNIVAGLDWH